MGGVQMDFVNRLRDLKADVQDKMEADQRMRTMQKYYPDWMKRTEEITGVPCMRPEDIAWDD